jgi:hypothetical protein
MLEGSVEGITRLLEAISGWGSIAGRELGKSLGNPSNVPIFLSSLVKFSLGPTLAFVLSQWAFRGEERRKEKKEVDAIRLMIRLELQYNLLKLEARRAALKRVLDDLQKAPSPKTATPRDIGLLVTRKRFLEIDLVTSSKTFTQEELEDLDRHYGALEFTEIKFRKLSEKAPLGELKWFDAKELELSSSSAIDSAREIMKSLKKTREDLRAPW